MFKHLLIPLDGTEMAERVLPVARGLAQAGAARITLLHVLEHSAPRSKHGQPHLRDKESAERYLHDLARRELAALPAVDWHVHDEAVKDVAGSLALHAEEFQPDLVVMCAHGSQWWKERVLGNLGQQLLHAMKERSAAQPRVPILLAQPGPDGRVHFPFRHILVPLDGSDEHERGLAPAAELALQLDIPMLLLTAIPTSGALQGTESATAALLPLATAEVLKLAEEDAARHLADHVRDLQAQGIAASGRVVRADPVKAVLLAAAEFHSDLIVLGTHALSATQAFWAASMTPRILQRAHASVLLANQAGEPE